MGWFQKGLSSASKQAQKMQFEADKMMRVKREEGAATDLRNKTQAKLAELGKAALAFCRQGSIQDPSMVALAAEIGGLESQLKDQETRLEAVRAEQWHDEGATPTQSPASAAAAPPAQPGPAAPTQAAAVSDTMDCPSCGAPIPRTAGFCPECGTKLK
jgi:hypothetical protein